MTKVPLGFIPDTLLVPLDQILPSRKTPTGLITSGQVQADSFLNR